MAPVLNIVGCGRAATALAALWHHSGAFVIGSILNRSTESAASAANTIGSGKPVATAADLPPATYTLIGTPDVEIETVAKTLSNLDEFTEHDTVFHLSGFHPAEVLRVAGLDRCRVASTHPIFSFGNHAAAISGFAGSWVGLEGEQKAVDQLQEKFETIGAQCVLVCSDAKPAYHAAGVMASNFVNAIVHASTRAFNAAGINEQQAKKLITPILQNTVNNIIADGAASSLTGPIVRADLETISEEQQWFEQNDALLAAVNRALGMATLDLARSSGRIDETQAQAVKKLLQPDD